MSPIPLRKEVRKANSRPVRWLKDMEAALGQPKLFQEKEVMEREYFRILKGVVG